MSFYNWRATKRQKNTREFLYGGGQTVTNEINFDIWEPEDPANFTNQEKDNPGVPPDGPKLKNVIGLDILTDIIDAIDMIYRIGRQPPPAGAAPAADTANNDTKWEEDWYVERGANGTLNSTFNFNYPDLQISLFPKLRWNYNQREVIKALLRTLDIRYRGQWAASSPGAREWEDNIFQTLFENDVKFGKAERAIPGTTSTDTTDTFAHAFVNAGGGEKREYKYFQRLAMPPFTEWLGRIAEVAPEGYEFAKNVLAISGVDQQTVYDLLQDYFEQSREMAAELFFKHYLAGELEGIDPVTDLEGTWIGEDAPPPTGTTPEDPVEIIDAVPGARMKLEVTVSQSRAYQDMQPLTEVKSLAYTRGGNRDPEPKLWLLEAGVKSDQWTRFRTYEELYYGGPTELINNGMHIVDVRNPANGLGENNPLLFRFDIDIPDQPAFATSRWYWETTWFPTKDPEDIYEWRSATTMTMTGEQPFVRLKDIPRPDHTRQALEFNVDEYGDITAPDYGEIQHYAPHLTLGYYNKSNVNGVHDVRGTLLIRATQLSAQWTEGNPPIGTGTNLFYRVHIQEDFDHEFDIAPWSYIPPAEDFAPVPVQDPVFYTPKFPSDDWPPFSAPIGSAGNPVVHPVPVTEQPALSPEMFDGFVPPFNPYDNLDDEVESPWASDLGSDIRVRFGSKAPYDTLAPYEYSTSEADWMAGNGTLAINLAIAGKINAGVPYTLTQRGDDPNLTFHDMNGANPHIKYSNLVYGQDPPAKIDLTLAQTKPGWTKLTQLALQIQMPDPPDPPIQETITVDGPNSSFDFSTLGWEGPFTNVVSPAGEDPWVFTGTTATTPIANDGDTVVFEFTGTKNGETKTAVVTATRTDSAPADPLPVTIFMEPKDAILSNTLYNEQVDESVLDGNTRSFVTFDWADPLETANIKRSRELAAGNTDNGFQLGDLEVEVVTCTYIHPNMDMPYIAFGDNNVTDCTWRIKDQAGNWQTRSIGMTNLPTPFTAVISTNWSTNVNANRDWLVAQNGTGWALLHWKLHQPPAANQASAIKGVRNVDSAIETCGVVETTPEENWIGTIHPTNTAADLHTVVNPFGDGSAILGGAWNGSESYYKQPDGAFGGFSNLMLQGGASIYQDMRRAVLGATVGTSRVQLLPWNLLKQATNDRVMLGRTPAGGGFFVKCAHFAITPK